MSRHANAGRKLSRNTSHRKALLDNLVRAVILQESITTTAPKAKEARKLVERVITKAKANTLAARRIVHRKVRDQEALAKLFDDLGPRFKARPGGYTRLIHTTRRVGDNAPMAILELVQKAAKGESEAKASPEKSEEKKTASPSGDQGSGGKKPPKQKAKKDE